MSPYCFYCLSDKCIRFVRREVSSFRSTSYGRKESASCLFPLLVRLDRHNDRYWFTMPFYNKFTTFRQYLLEYPAKLAPYLKRGDALFCEQITLYMSICNLQGPVQTSLQPGATDKILGLGRHVGTFLLVYPGVFFFSF